MQLEIERYLADSKDICAQIRALKRLLGARWERPMAREQRELGRLKLRATELCVLRAASRGKQHLRRSGGGEIEYERSVVERLLPVYALRLEQSA